MESRAAAVRGRADWVGWLGWFEFRGDAEARTNAMPTSGQSAQGPGKSAAPSRMKPQLMTSPRPTQPAAVRAARGTVNRAPSTASSPPKPSSQRRVWVSRYASA